MILVKGSNHECSEIRLQSIPVEDLPHLVHSLSSHIEH
jgi:hypothetical protein